MGEEVYDSGSSSFGDYFYTADHLGSVREMVDNSVTVRARYDYDPYGRRTKLSGDLDSQFGFTGFFFHSTSDLNLTLYRAYDTEVQGNAIIRPGEADAGLIAPLPGERVGLALATDGNPFYGVISPFWSGATAVAEAMRNVAAIGAVPSGITAMARLRKPKLMTAKATNAKDHHSRVNPSDIFRQTVKQISKPPATAR